MRQYGLIGYPLLHSFSKKYFTEKFLRQEIYDAEFLNFSIPEISELNNIFFDHPQLKGLAITIPYKKSVIEYIDDVSEIVKETGACNCIKIWQQIKTGYNTDVTGFEKSFTKHLKSHHTKALILGSGGSAAAVQYVLRKLQINYRIISRTISHNNLNYSDINELLLQEYTIIINCTPLGTYPEINNMPYLPYQFLSPKHYLFDMVYNPPLTQFLQHGGEQGCVVQNGYEMLVIQAEENWKIWNE